MKFLGAALVAISLFMLGGVGCSTTGGTSSLNQAGTSKKYQLLGDIEQMNLEEPSGIAYHPVRNTIFVVGDEGDLAELKLDGTPINDTWLRDGDFEGVAVDPSSSRVYIAEERAEKILEVDPDELVILREFKIPRHYQGKLMLQSGEEGLEGVTFVPQENHPEGGVFYVTQQSFDISNKNNPSAVIKLELPLRSSSSESAPAKILRFHIFNEIDLAGLHYNAKNQSLFILSGSDNKVFIAGADFLSGKSDSIVGSFAIPGEDQEGITEDGDGDLYLAQDTGGILKLSPLK